MSVKGSNCEYKCSSQTELKVHVERHTGEKSVSVCEGSVGII